MARYSTIRQIAQMQYLQKSRRVGAGLGLVWQLFRPRGIRRRGSNHNLLAFLLGDGNKRAIKQ